MGNFNRDRGDRRDRGGFDRRGSGRDFNRGGGFSRPSMHQAICDDCGKECQVPFKPSGDKPIYCSDCFGKHGGGASRPNKFGGDRDRRPRFEDRPANTDSKEKEILKAIKTLNYKVDQLMKVLAPDVATKPADIVANEIPAKVETKKTAKKATPKKKTTAKKKAVAKKKK